jgi:hypothetical protein
MMVEAMAEIVALPGPVAAALKHKGVLMETSFT